METTQIIFSINVHENIEFLIKQIKNINDFVSLDYIIILNANKLMYNKISNCKFINSQENNIILYPKYLDKRRYHGSLTEGIYNNMKYALNNYNFKYFIVLSSRNLFYNHLNNTEKIKALSLRPAAELGGAMTVNGGGGWAGTYKQLLERYAVNNRLRPKKSWHWLDYKDRKGRTRRGGLLKTKLSKYVKENNLNFAVSPHEGLTFNYNSCLKIIEFLDNNPDIKTNLFQFCNCVEEFALQTICVNSGDYFCYIGNGSHTDILKKVLKERYVYKTLRK